MLIIIIIVLCQNYSSSLQIGAVCELTGTNCQLQQIQ